MLTLFGWQILVPYVRAKAHDWYEQLGGGADSDLFAESTHQQPQTQSLQSVSSRQCLYAGLYILQALS